MDDTTLRSLAGKLLAQLPTLIPEDPERTPIADSITAGLAGHEGGAGPEPLLDALAAHPVTRAWMRQHGAAEDVVRGGLPGNSTTPRGLYYVCPEEDEDLILLTVPAAPPVCPIHGVLMILEQG